MKKISLGLLACILIGVFFLAGCAPLSATPTSELPGNDWQTAAPGEVGLDEQLLNEAVERIDSGDYANVHAVLIIKEGKLVFEDYFSGYTWDYNGENFRGELVEFDKNRLHNLASVTKSFTSALIGIAIDRGLIPSVEEKVWAFFPEYDDLRDATKDSISLEHLLTMTSGLEWNGMDIHVSTRDTRNDLIQLFLVDDPIAYVLAKPVVEDPGSHWYYNGGGTNVLGEVIRAATGMRMDAFAENYLFAPLGITDYEWDSINQDVIHASGNLRLRPRDIAKFGYVYLNDGIWQGERIISEGWVRNSSQNHMKLSGTSGYGYQWWLTTYRSGTRSYDVFYAAGWGGQRIVVFPALDMVVVFTGGNYVEAEPVDEIIERYILPAVKVQ
jgi:CubicO group peptidase (beta-lactamase class C family)